MDSLETGQRVRFDKPHPSMSPHLRRLAGEVGKVIAIGEGAASNKVLVAFDGISDHRFRQWWIPSSRLSPVH